MLLAQRQFPPFWSSSRASNSYVGQRLGKITSKTCANVLSNRVEGESRSPLFSRDFSARRWPSRGRSSTGTLRTCRTRNLVLSRATSPSSTQSIAPTSAEMDESRDWLRSYKQREKERQTLARDFQTKRDREIKTTIRKSATTTMKQPVVFQNELSAGMYDDNKTGFKDRFDPCNKSNKSNGGDFRTYASVYGSSFAEPDKLPVRFREDGVPISAQRTGKSLMSPKPPSDWERTEGKRIRAKNDHTSIVLGNPHMADPKLYRSVSHTFHKKHHRMLMQPNPGIASEDAKRAHLRTGLSGH